MDFLFKSHRFINKHVLREGLKLHLRKKKMTREDKRDRERGRDIETLFTIKINYAYAQSYWTKSITIHHAYTYTLSMFLKQ